MKILSFQCKYVIHKYDLKPESKYMSYTLHISKFKTINLNFFQMHISFSKKLHLKQVIIDLHQHFN